MRYDDASQSVSTGHSEPVARPDVDILPPGSFGPATGNAITGQGTNSGPAGADSVGASPAITQVQGAGGQTVVSNGNFQVPGQYGVLQMDQQGNFNYVRNPNTPAGVKDVFNYTVADAAGNSSTTLTIDIAEVTAGAAQGVVTLPAGVQLSDIHVNGHDLVINMPDGTQMVIPNGAVFVPEITIGDVQVPPTNIAALLIDSEPQPAAGPAPSSGGDWNDPVPPLDPGVPLGDLIPPTELFHTPPTFVEPAGFINTIPTVIIETPDFPAGAVDASESVFEKGLPARDGNLPNEPAGSGEIADGNGTNNSDPSETNTGTIVFTAQDGLGSITVDGVAITQVGQTIQGQYGTMTITSIDLAHGQIGYSYTLGDNTSGDNTADHFAVVVTDSNGDQATATLTVNIVDDVPTARNDTDSLDSNHTATGNVMTGAGTTSGAAGADTVGADNATLTAISSNSTGQSDATFDASGNLVVHGEFGTLTIMADGSYVYTLDQGAHGGANDVFTYTLTDGDGDTSTATLTINVPLQNLPPTASDSAVTVSEEVLPSGNHDAGGSDSDTDSTTASGTIVASDPNGDPLTMKLGIPTGTYTSHGETVHWSVSPDGHTLTGYTGSDPTANHVVVVTIADNGSYNVQLLAQFDDPSGNGENSINFNVPVTVDDGHGGTAGAHITVTVEDDTPIVSLADVSIPSLTVDETNLGTDDSKSFASAFSVSFGADGPAASNSLVYTLGISATGADSGLIDTATGNHVFLFVQGGEVVGKEGTDANAAASGPVVFTLSIDASTGVVTLDQSRAVVQPDGTNPDTSEGVTLAAANLVTVTATATDYDGDHATQSLNIGTQLHFLDDGPIASPDTNSTDAGTTLTVTAASSSDVLHNDVSGADGYAAGGGVVGVAAGTDTSVALSTGVGTVIHGTYGDLTLNADGSYTYVAKPNVTGVDHFVYTIEDGDGDTSTTTLNITVNPVTAAVGSDSTIVSEEVLLGGTEHGGDTDSDPSNDVLVNSGNISLTDSISGATFTTALTAPSGTYTSGGVTIVWALSNGGHTLTGTAGSTTVLVATIDNTGHYTVTLSAPIDTPNGVNAGENGGDSIIAIGVTATDNFGNTLTSGTLTVNVEDDHPIASPDTNSTDAGTTLTVTAASTSDVLHNDVSGADGYAAGGGVVGVAAGTNTSVALSTGVGTVIHGTYGDLTLNADGSYTYVAKPNVTGVDHFVYTIEDGDGDTSTTTLNITVNPVTAGVGSASTVVSEEVLPVVGTERGGDTDSDPSNDVLVNSGNISLTDSISGATFTTALTAPSGTYTSGGTTIVWALSNGGHTLTGTAGSTTVLVATIDNTGHYTVTLSAPIDTPNGVNAGENGGDSIIAIGVTATDNFGNTLTSGTLTVNVEDDHPIAQTSGNGVGTVTLDESAVGTDTPGGSPPVGLASATINLAAGFATGSSVIYGADGPGSVAYALHLSGSNVGSGLYALDPTDTSTSDGDGYGQGSQILLNQSGNTITGSVGSTVYFTITINPTTGVATFTQMNNIWNPVAGSSGAALDDTATLTTTLASALQVVQTVTDYDGDTSTASINLGQGVFQIEDSGPTAIHPDSITTTDIVQGPIFAYLDTDHSVLENFGTDGPGTITFANITNGMDSGLTSGGSTHHITYWLSTDGQTLEGRVDSTNGSDGTLVFEVHIDQSTSQYDYQQFGIVDNGSGISFNNLTSTAAGNVDYRGVGADATGNPDADLLISGTQSDGTIGTINTDSTAIGVANQSMDAGESARIDFVTGLTSGAATTTGFNFTGHIETTGFIGLIPQVQGSQATTVDFTVYALESTLTGSGTPDSNPMNGISDGTLAQVTSVYVQDYLTGNTATLDISGLAVGSTTAVGFGVTVTKNADGSVTFHGIQEGDHYGVTTATNFNAIIVHDVSGSFDLGVFSLTQTNTGNPVNLSYDLQIKDADGDTVALPGAINITLDPTTQQAALINNAVTNNVVTTSSTSTSGLIPGNDNGSHGEHRAFAVGQSATWMAALAAAGLEAEHAKLDFHALAGSGGHLQTMTPLVAASTGGATFGSGSTVSPTHIVETTLGSNTVAGDQVASGRFHQTLEQLHGFGHAEAHSPALTSLLNGAGPIAHGPVAHAGPIMASGVAMPSALQLIAAMGGHAQPQNTVAGADHNQAVGQVLSDALHGGGGHGPSIDSLLSGPASHATHDVIEALASHAGSAVSFGHSGLAGAFHGSHNMFSMNGMAHHDAAPHHG